MQVVAVIQIFVQCYNLQIVHLQHANKLLLFKPYTRISIVFMWCWILWCWMFKYAFHHVLLRS